MSTPVSACTSLAKIPTQNIRPVANFHPNIWGDQFINYTPKDKVTRACKEEQVEDLKKEVRRKLMATAASSPSQLLNFIEVVQRLGVAYHFEGEIEEALQHIYGTFHDGSDMDGDLYNIALRFRLLRKQGYNISCEIFDKFKDEKGGFKETLIPDVQGMLGLYEASHLWVHGEDILEEALAFTTTHLKAMVESLRYPLAEQVSHAVKRPIRKGLERLEARWYISIYQDEASHDETLLKLAKLDFNLVQSLHKEELSNLSRWDINNIDHLPEYMKLFYVALLDVYNEIEEEMEKQGYHYRLHHAIEAMKNQVQAYFGEAKWFHEHHIPTIEEYMRIALPSSGYSLLTTLSFIGMGEIVTKEAFDWVISDPKIIIASSVIARFMDDMTSHKFEKKRGHVASGIECYMKQYGVSEEQVYNEFHNQIMNPWMDINQECLKPTAIPMPLLNRVLNLSRVIDVIYKQGDGYTHVGKVMKNNIGSLLIDSKV